MDWAERLKTPRYWLLGIAAAIAAVHLAMIDRVGEEEILATSGLFWLVAGSLVWDKREDLNLQSGPIASLIGAGLVGFFLLRSATPAASSLLLCVLPFLAVLGIALLASGASGLRQYWRELLIFGLLALNPVLKLILNAIDLPLLTAKAATMLLWYTGFDVVRQGVFLNLPTGRVEVYGACSGVQSILQMINIAILFLLMAPAQLRWVQKIFCIGMAIVLGFVVNAARVALMAILVAFSQQGAFKFWHDGQGSLIFSVIAVLLFGGFCWLCFLRNPDHSDLDKSDPGATANA